MARLRQDIPTITLCLMLIALTAPANADTIADPPALALCQSLAGYFPLNPIEEKAAAGQPPGMRYEEIDAPKAVAACAQAVQASPNNARANLNYGRALERAGRYRSALSFYEKAISGGGALAERHIGILYHGPRDPAPDDPYAGKEDLPPSLELARRWLLKAADHGDLEAMNLAAGMLFQGEGGAADPEKAAAYWRSLAAMGAFFANRYLAVGIEDGRIRPTSPTELTDRLTALADGDDYYASMDLAQRLRDQKDLSGAAHYAFLAYEIASAASSDQEYGLVTLQLSAIGLVKELVAAGAPIGIPLQDYEKITRDFDNTPTLQVSYDFTCAGGNTQKFQLYAWNWSRDYSPIDPQIDWMEKHLGCKAPEGLRKFFQDTYAQSRKSDGKYAQLLHDIYEHPPQNNNPSADAGSGVTAGQVVGGIIVGAAAIASIYMCSQSDSCSKAAELMAKHLMEKYVLEPALKKSVGAQ